MRARIVFGPVSALVEDEVEVTAVQDWMATRGRKKARGRFG